MDQPQGELLSKTIAMPADTNPNGDIFGGWLLSQMDLSGAVAAKRRARSRVVTVAINSMTFLKPVSVGDLVCCYGLLVNEGKTSMTYQIQVWILKHPFTEERVKVTEGLFTFVAVNQDGKSIPIDPP